MSADSDLMKNNPVGKVKNDRPTAFVAKVLLRGALGALGRDIDVGLDAATAVMMKMWYTGYGARHHYFGSHLISIVEFRPSSYSLCAHQVNLLLCSHSWLFALPIPIAGARVCWA